MHPTHFQKLFHLISLFTKQYKDSNKHNGK